MSDDIERLFSLIASEGSIKKVELGLKTISMDYSQSR